jgi:hypothetical protein
MKTSPMLEMHPGLRQEIPTYDTYLTTSASHSDEQFNPDRVGSFISVKLMEAESRRRQQGAT